MDRRFHLIGRCVSTHEKTVDFQFMFKTIQTKTLEFFGVELIPNFLVSHAAHSIKNGFVAVFGQDNNVIMCWVSSELQSNEI